MSPDPDPGRRVVVQADGGSRGNPGPAGYGAVVFAADGTTVLAERAAAIGRATNNVAEYSGLIAGLEAALELGARSVAVQMDSKLVIEQMSGRWKVKHPDMKPLAGRAATLAARFAEATFTWIPRERNAHADRLANEAMDAAAAGRVWAATGAVAVAADDPPSAARSDPLPDPPSDAPPDPAAAPPPRNGQPTRFLVVRHGQSTFGAQGRFTGREDVPLTEIGRSQAAAVARRIAPAGPVVVLTSPLVRCRETAAAVAGPAAAPLIEDDRLLDEQLGDWTGLREAEIGAGWPAELARWRRDPAAAPPGGESFLQVRDRVRPVLTEALSTYRGHAVVLVTHAAVAKMILTTALQADPAVAFRLRVDTGSLSAVDVDAAGGIVVRSVNETAHLP
ncbi:bifunctional RNase H/acid phosphatase [Nakamurella sp.]|uniref:bifunctional RNase H/acid phosphatase n=1 Tax=Nakamurella sp. TaxID=1869182 RepID=UPI003B3AE156